jgi:hypothetical protein
MMEPEISTVPDRSATPKRRWFLRSLLWLLILLGTGLLTLMWWWDVEREPFDVVTATETAAKARGERVVVGTVLADTLVSVAGSMLDKRGGYLSNDVLPPGVIMDNVPNWEFGVLVQCRDLSRALRNGFSRSQTQSIEDRDLQEADPLFSFTNDRWMFPRSEGEYRDAIGYIEKYRTRLQDNDSSDAQFYARADNLADYLALVESRLGSLSQRLSASVGPSRINTDLGNDGQATQSKPAPEQGPVRTPWNEIDDVFYEARGSAFALAQFLKAIDQDFAKVLEDKNARVSLRQIIRELEDAQRPVNSPMILNGSPFGFFANHSLVMANYISRANASIIDLRKLLERG